MTDFSPLEGAVIDRSTPVPPVGRVVRCSSVCGSTEELRVNMKAPDEFCLAGTCRAGATRHKISNTSPSLVQQNSPLGAFRLQEPLRSWHALYKTYLAAVRNRRSAASIFFPATRASFGLPTSINRALPSIGYNLRPPGGHMFRTPLDAGRPVGRRGDTKFHFCRYQPIAARYGDVPLAWDIGVAALQKHAVPSLSLCVNTTGTNLSASLLNVGEGGAKAGVTDG